MPSVLNFAIFVLTRIYADAFIVSKNTQMNNKKKFYIALAIYVVSMLLLAPVVIDTVRSEGLKKGYMIVILVIMATIAVFRLRSLWKD